MQSEQRKKRSERARLSTLSQRDRRAIQQVSDEKKRARRVQASDLVTALLQQWRLCDLVRNTKLLLLLLNRNRYAPPQRQLHGPEKLLYYQQHGEYYDTLFAEYALVPCQDGARPCFRLFYNSAYRDAKRFLQQAQQSQEERAHHMATLRALFVCALVHDARMRRFVFSRHDIHTHCLNTVAPCVRKAHHFIDACRAPVNRFFHGVASLPELAEYAVAQWEECYAKRM